MDHITNFYVISVVILIAISALFSFGETLMTAVSRAKIHRLANEGNKNAKKLEKMLMQREKVVSAMLVGNNIVNILASAIATSALIALFGEAGVVYATIIMTILVIIFAEIAPKTLALKASGRTALFLTPLLSITTKILYPLTWMAQSIVNLFVNLLCAKQHKNSNEAELEEIRETLEFKHKEGSLFKHDKDLLDGVLDLSDTEISEIMVHRKDVESINIDLPITEIVKLATEISYTRIPLWRGDKENIVAILNVRKLLKALHTYRNEVGNDIEKFDLKLVTSDPWFVPSNNSLRSQLFAFRKKKKRFALVVDEYGSLLGLVTLEDILEEIVGEIKEQDENNEINIIRVKSGSYKIVGKAMIRDINKKLEWDLLEDDHAYNLAAFVINYLGRIPEERETFLIKDYYFEILKRRNHDITLLKVKKINRTPTTSQ
jgi:Mg2+/Co2+ transporter CorB